MSYSNKDERDKENGWIAKQHNENVDPMRETMDCLHRALEGSLIRENGVEFPREELMIRPTVLRAESGKASIAFTVEHPSFAEPFIDRIQSIGATLYEAIHRATESFLFGALGGMRHCVRREYVRELSTNFFEEPRRWKVSDSRMESVGGTRAPKEGYWGLIAANLVRHLGNKKYYWVKVFVGRETDGTASGEVSINGYRSRELSAVVTDYARNWPPSTQYRFDRQYFFLTQEDAICSAYPFSREQVETFTEHAVALLGGEQSRPEGRYVHELTTLTGDENLAVELHSFLPEICAENAFPEAAFNEKVVLLYDGTRLTQDHPAAYKDQFTSYRWIQKRALEGFDRGEFPQEVYKRLIQKSATHDCVIRLQKAGNALKDACITTAMNVPSGYKVR